MIAPLSEALVDFEDLVMSGVGIEIHQYGF